MKAIAALLLAAIAASASGQPPLDEDAAAQLLDARLRHDHSYRGRISLDCVRYDDEGVAGLYFLFALREQHGGQCGGDPQTAPVIERYRVDPESRRIEQLDLELGWLPYAPLKPAHKAQCVRYSGDVTLRGVLSRHTYAEQPNYESIAKGDAAATYFFITPKQPLCVAGDEDGSPAEPAVATIQLILDSKAAYDALRPSLGRQVQCNGNLFPRNTGHHHSAVLLDNAGCGPAP